MKCKCGAIHRTGKCQFNQDQETRIAHNELTAEINRKRRHNPEIRKIINERNNESRRRRMQDPKYRARVNIIARKRLEDPEKYKRKLETNNASYRRLKEKPNDKYIVRLQRNKIIGKKIRDRDREYGIKFYGGICACCMESHIEFLGIDHTNGGGTKHRKAIKGAPIYRWLRQNKYPKGFRVLCHNCNMSLGFYGYCPHKVNHQ